MRPPSPGGMGFGISLAPSPLVTPPRLAANLLLTFCSQVLCRGDGGVRSDEDPRNGGVRDGGAACRSPHHAVAVAARPRGLVAAYRPHKVRSFINLFWWGLCLLSAVVGPCQNTVVPTLFPPMPEEGGLFQPGAAAGDSDRTTELRNLEQYQPGCPKCKRKGACFFFDLAPVSLATQVVYAAADLPAADGGLRDERRTLPVADPVHLGLPHRAVHRLVDGILDLGC